MATRLAPGGSPWQIQWQLWIENLLLALIGGAAGTGIAWLALRGLLRMLPIKYQPVTEVSIDGSMRAARSPGMIVADSAMTVSRPTAEIRFPAS